MALPINIDNLIKKETVESERIEFKQGWNPESILHTLCAFANDMNNWGGGYIIIGIQEEKGVPILPPIGINQNQIDKIQKDIISLSFRISPNYTPIISHEIYLGKDIIIIYAPGGDNRPYDAPKELNNKHNQRISWVRKGSLTVQATPADRVKLLELAKKTPFDDRVNHEASIEDFSLALIQSFLQEVKSDLYKEIPKLSLQDLARKMNIARGSSEALLPLNVGLLLFTENPDLYFGGCKTEVIILKDEIGDNFEEKAFTGPIHSQLRNTLSFIKSNIIMERIEKIPGKAEASRVYNYPYEAIEEAIANAVYHRSYELLNPIEINIRLDRIEILSFPGPLPPLDNQALKQERVTARDYRNRRIGDFLKELHLTEGRGTGFPKIRASLKKNGSPAPVFKTDKDRTSFLTIIPCHLAFVDINLDDYKISILKFCNKEKTKKELLEHIGLSNRSSNAQRYLQPLIDNKLIAYKYPDIIQHPRQRYITTTLGQEKLKEKV